MTSDPFDRVEIILGNIVRLEIDAIVNAANTSLLGGGGVDGAIHRAAGPELVEECRTLGGCPTGEARLTLGYHLPARHVIHAVGPVYRNGKSEEPALLAACYRNSLALAFSNQLKAIAFPAISTGVYRYPKRAAARIAQTTTLEWLREHDVPERVTFVQFGAADQAVYEEVLEELKRGWASE